MTTPRSVRVVVAALVLAGCGGNGLDLSGVILESNNSPIALPDNAQPPANYPSTIAVSTPKTSISSISVLVNLTHAFPDDVDLLLVGPGGQSSWLMSDSFGGTNLSSQPLLFQDGSPPCPDGTVALPLATTVYAPTNNDASGANDTFFAGPPPVVPAWPYGASLSVFLGTNPNGTWRLYAKDDAAGITGTVNGWLLSISAD